MDTTPADAAVADPNAGRRPTAGERTFRRLLVNTLVTGVTSSFLWFALTFWVYLETRSVVATGVIGGAFSLSSAVLGPAFGTYVDRHRKHHAMVLATAVSLGLLRRGDGRVPRRRRRRACSTSRARGSGCFVALTLLGSVAGQMRGIALSTCVTLLVPDDRRDRANGLVGTVTGVSFAITSVFSGLVIGQLGMGWALYGSVASPPSPSPTCCTIRDRRAGAVPGRGRHAGHVDIRGALEAIRAVPGLLMLILLAAFNNLLGGRLHGADGRLRAVARVGRDVGPAVRLHQPGVHRRRPGRGQVRPRPRPVRVVLLGNLVNWTSARRSRCARRSCC